MNQGTGMAEKARTILVVEDYADTRTLLKLMLESQGFEVFEVDNGLDAVKVAEAIKPDLILMDMSLPGIDGYQATRRIRAQEGSGQVPIIACSAHNQWEWRAKAIIAGCTEFIRKPIDFASLNAIVGRALGPGNAAHQGAR